VHRVFIVLRVTWWIRPQDSVHLASIMSTLHKKCRHRTFISENNVAGDIILPYVHGSTAPLREIKISWSKSATAPPKNKGFTVLYCNCHPFAGTSRGVQRVQLGLALGLGVRGRGRRIWGWGVRECWEGFLTAHRKASRPLAARTALKR